MDQNKNEARAAAQRQARPEHERALLQRIAAGGPKPDRAVAELVQAYRRPLLAMFLRQGIALEEGEDLAQEVFVKVVRGAGGFRGEGAPSAWIFAIAGNELISHLRRRRPEIPLDDEGWASVADSIPAPATGADPALDNCVAAAFARFARDHPQRAEALRRIALDGWSVAEVAAFLGRTAGATREYLSQTRKKFKAFLAPCRELLEGS